MGRILASRAFAAVSAILAAAIIWICTAQQNASAWIAGRTDGAADCVESFAEQLSQGDWDAAAAFLMGSPKLDIPDSPEIEMQLWAAFVDSVECLPVGECFPVPSGVAQEIRLHHLDLSAAADAIKEQTQSLLASRVEAAEDMAEVYTEAHDYRPDFLSRLLRDAAAEAIAEAPVLEQTLTLHLQLQDGQWAIIPDTTLLAALSGGIL